MVYVNASFHGSLKLTLGFPLLQSVSYFGKQRRMERVIAGNNRERERDTFLTAANTTRDFCYWISIFEIFYFS